MALSGKHAEVTLNRLSVFTSSDKSEANLYSKLYKSEHARVAPSFLAVNTILPAPGRISFQEATNGSFVPAKLNDKFGPSWSTHWFKIEFVVPENWKGEEVHLLWDCECEALLWTIDGTPLQAFLGSGGDDRRAEYIITDSANGGEKLQYYVEMSCTAMFGNGKGNGWGGLGPNPTDLQKSYTLKQVELAVHDRLASDLLKDFVVMADLARQLPKDSIRAAQALWTANKIMNVFRLDDRSSWQKCRDIAQKEFFSVKNASSQHNISAIGHCHIDTAWLWPYAETKRKCARSWATQLRICERHPEYKFGCSQAQQYEWVKQIYPSLYAQVKDAVIRTKQFVPLGGTWVEMDCNLPSGESLVRQFLFGQRFFKEEFGFQCNEFWLPDTFGYAAQLPQIIESAEIEYFVTQKLSWAQFNKFPHHTFYWEGLDGSRVLTHFPPTDTYNAQANVKDTLFHVQNFKEKERSSESMMVFGHGDGGGGPLMSMVETLERMKDVDGLARISMRSPTEFFDRVKKEAQDLAVWVGELYFEYHRGTYTSQAKNKLENRLCEFLLHDIELLSIITSVNGGNFAYPSQELSELWKLLLLNQFHDVIPGSSIQEVYKDSAEHYEHIHKIGENLLEKAIRSFVSGQPTSTTSPKAVAVNTLSWNRREVVEVKVSDISSAIPASHQLTRNGTHVLCVASAPSVGFSVISNEALPSDGETKAFQEGEHFFLENSFLKATINKSGNVISLIDKRHNNRQVIEEGKNGNQFVIYEDVPMYWDAWDVDVYHLEQRSDIVGKDVQIVETGPLRATLEVSVKISDKSQMIQRISLDSLSARLDFDCEVDWHESHKFLKVEFPLKIRSMKATYETQFGHLERPTHWNTSWEVAKFEVCGHKWADLSEARYGVALLNDSKYGYATHLNVMRLSLLRSPKNPDPEADMGHHHFKYALLPHANTFQDANVIREGYNFNVPLKVVLGTESSATNSFVSVDDNAIVIDTIKKAEDDNSVIIRLYESFGSHTSCTLRFDSFAPKNVKRVNILEHDISTTGVEWNGNSIALQVKPFEIITLKLN